MITDGFVMVFSCVVVVTVPNDGRVLAVENKAFVVTVDGTENVLSLIVVIDDTDVTMGVALL